MKKLLVSSLIALAAVAMLVTPAVAAVPQTNPQQTVVCDSFGNTAKLWYAKKRNVVTRLAVDARECAAWMGVVIADGNDGASLVAVAPGAHFNRHVRYRSPADYRPFLRAVGSTEMCEDWWTSAHAVWPGSHGRLKPASTARWCG